MFIGDINTAGAEKIAAEYPDATITQQMNVAKRADWDAALKTIMEKWGKVDILINNAGTSYKNKPTLDVTEEEYYRCFDVNCLGIFHSVAAVFPMFVEKKGGICVNISSCGASRPRQGLVWYNASKGAVSNVGASAACDRIELTSAIRQPKVLLSNLAHTKSGSTVYALSCVALDCEYCLPHSPCTSTLCG